MLMIVSELNLRNISRIYTSNRNSTTMKKKNIVAIATASDTVECDF